LSEVPLQKFSPPNIYLGVITRYLIFTWVS